MILRHLLELSYEQAERAFRDGRCSARDWERFWCLWVWSAPRFSGTPGAVQEAYYKARGREAYERRINRVRLLADRLLHEGA